MTTGARLEFLVLGPLEARIEGRSIPLGGAKQGAVLALLLLHANEVVSIERLMDEIWGDEPPPSAAHTLAGLVSRLRREVDGNGPALVRRGDGYFLDLGDAVIDAHLARNLVDSAAQASDAGDHRRASELAQQALRLWRGPALTGTRFCGGARHDVEQLEELRLRAFEQLAEAELALGRNEDAMRGLWPVVREHPYRERAVAQLMVGLYRSGRQAEALEIYEQTRRALGDDLGVRPSAELRRLSGEIARQDPRLAGPNPAEPTGSSNGPDPPRKRTTLRALAVTGAIVAAVSVALAARGEGERAAAKSPRVALVVPRSARAYRPDTFVTPLVDGLRLAERKYGIRTEILVADELNPKAASVATAVERVRSGGFDLVVVANIGLAQSLAPALPLPSTRWVVLDSPVDIATATGVIFDDRQAGYLAGYLSGLMETADAPRLNRAHVVSAIGGIRGVRAVDQLIQGFASGVRRALPDVNVLIAYSDDFVDSSKCEAIANRQIDAGADIVFAAAGTCSLGALSAAALRGVWGVGVDEDQSYLGEHVLASTFKRGDQAVFGAVRSFVNGTLPGGRTISLGLDSDAVGLTGLNPSVPESIRRKVARMAAALRKGVESPR